MIKHICKSFLVKSLRDAGFDATHFLHNGARIKGSSSGATGIVYIAPQDKTFDMSGCTTEAGTGLTVPSTAGLVKKGRKFPRKK